MFIVGLPRSGTTLIEQVLASHSRVHGAGELLVARQTFDAVPRATGREFHPIECVRYLDGSSIRRLAEGYLEQVSSLTGDLADRVTDKMPDNYLYLGFLSMLFPHALLIECRRDLRDVALSCWMTDFRSVLWANDKAQIASRIHQYERLMDHWRAVLPSPIHEVHYEEAVSDLENTARRLVKTCGLEWEPACLEPHRAKRAVRSASLVQVRRPVYRNSVGRWKHYETELADLFAALSCASSDS